MLRVAFLSVLYSGKIPFAPGTWGSLVSVFLGLPFLYFSQEQKNALNQYSKKEKIELWDSLNKICHLLESIAIENYDRRKNRVKALLNLMKSLMENEKNKLNRKMSEINSSISSSSYSDQEQPPEGEITYANPKLKKIPPGHDPLLELISKETV